MSEAEGFAARWSRLKRETAEAKTQADAAQPGPAAAAGQGAEAAPPKGGRPPEPAFDPKSLPPIESITAASDIKAFLQAGVPRELTRAALRRVWTADPAIRDFIGLAENQWDFTDPTAMPGFGPLEATDDVRQLVSQAMGQSGNLTEVPERVALASEGARAPDGAAAQRETPAPLQTDSIPEENTCLRQADAPEQDQHRPELDGAPHVTPAENTGETCNRRTHGGALPK